MHNAYSAIGKEQNPAICTNKDGIEGLSAKWNKPGTERQTAQVLTRVS
jgi:hypothetical protein